MRIAYLILAHKNLGQLLRLVKKLHTDNTWIYIHFDCKTQLDLNIIEELKKVGNTCFVQKRVDVKWGGYSIVEATLNGLREISSCDRGFDYITLMSGQDYPIKSNEYIVDFFVKNAGHEFIYYLDFPSNIVPEYLSQRTHFYYDYDRNYDAIDSPARRNYELVMKKRDIKRRFIPGMNPFYGSQWWSLTGKCVKYILNTVDSDMQIKNFYRYTKFSDEQLFQTIVMNSDFSANTLNENLWYLDWSQAMELDDPWNGSHPKLLRVEDMISLMSSDRLFARKFDEIVDSEVLDMIDEIL